MDTEPVDLEWRAGRVSGLWDRPADPQTALVLAHGAGKDMHDPLLAALSAGCAAEGIAVLRFNFPYREAGRRAPGSQAEAEDCYRDVATQVSGVFERVWLGGKSYGGRMASHIVADATPADGLVFLGYPLHPPGKPDRLRDAHLDRVTVPMLFCQGTRDPFARPDLLEAVVTRLPTATLHPVDGGDHSFRCGGRSAEDVHRELMSAIVAFVT